MLYVCVLCCCLTTTFLIVSAIASTVDRVAFPARSSAFPNLSLHQISSRAFLFHMDECGQTDLNSRHQFCRQLQVRMVTRTPRPSWEVLFGYIWFLLDLLNLNYIRFRFRFQPRCLLRSFPWRTMSESFNIAVVVRWFWTSWWDTPCQQCQQPDSKEFESLQFQPPNGLHW